MTTAEIYWQYQQLEPSDILITGKFKREPRRHFVDVLPPEPARLSEYEQNKKEDAWIESKQHKQ
jgi:hypothetical protein